MDGKSSLSRELTHWAQRDERISIGNHQSLDDPLLKPESFIKLSSDARDPVLPHGMAGVPILSNSA